MYAEGYPAIGHMPLAEAGRAASAYHAVLDRVPGGFRYDVCQLIEALETEHYEWRDAQELDWYTRDTLFFQLHLTGCRDGLGPPAGRTWAGPLTHLRRRAARRGGCSSCLGRRVSLVPQGLTRDAAELIEPVVRGASLTAPGAGP